MIHNVNSYSSNFTSTEHNLVNCVHKHKGGFLDTDMDLKMSSENQENLQTEKEKLPTFDLFTGGIKKILGKGIGFLKGIWNEQSDSGQKTSITGRTTDQVDRSNGKTDSTGMVSVPGVETLADVKVPKQASVQTERQVEKAAGAIPALRVKTGQARERFEAKKDAFLKRMKEMAKNRRGFFKDSREERPGQQEKQMEWFEMKNEHLLDSYNKNGEYTNLGNRTSGYSGNPMKDNYSSKA